MIKTEQLTKTYRLGEVDIHAVNDVNLDVRPGELVAIMGASGSGKSTLLHLLGGIDRPTSGKVWVDDICVSDLDDTRITLFRREKMGFVFQFFNLLPTLNVEENVALPLLIAGKKPHTYTARIHELLHLMGLYDRRLHRPSQLSGGQQQRVGIARAFVIDPKIVLLDEPTGNLDSQTSTHLLNVLAETRRQFGTTMVVVTHNSIDAAYSDRVVFLKDGGIVDMMERASELTYTAETINHTLLAL